MLKNNHGFTCLGCGREISHASKTSRNHCPNCFMSLHVDKELPGDRESDCKSLMIPISYFVKNGTIKITFLCTKCYETHNNKVASDDEIGRLDESIQKWKREYPNVGYIVE